MTFCSKYPVRSGHPQPTRTQFTLNLFRASEKLRPIDFVGEEQWMKVQAE